MNAKPLSIPAKATAERILVIEDDHAVQKALRRLFEKEGYSVDTASDGAAGLESFRKHAPAAVVLDLWLPGKSGQEVCSDMKATSPDLPIVVLSAKTDVSDKVLLLELGADDYVTKPFSPRELLARVRAATRRSNRGFPASSEVFTFGNVNIDFSKMEASRDGQPVQLTAQEFKILRFMFDRPEHVLSREELLTEVWGYQNYPSTRTVDNHILKLRQKLEPDPSRPMHFRTVHSAGYKFVP
jgi:DNA-binding response OmpR family regulator